MRDKVASEIVTTIWSKLFEAAWDAHILYEEKRGEPYPGGVNFLMLELSECLEEMLTDAESDED
jgi:hypothetical protein